MKVTIATVLIVFLTGCVFVSKPRVYTFANKPFDLNEYNRIETSILDTDAYYYKVEMLIIGSDGKSAMSIVEDTSYHILQFLSNGQLRWMNLDHKPTLLEAKTSGYADYHYYRIEGGILKLEIYGDPMNGFDYWAGNIYEDSIVFFKINNAKTSHVYLKVKD